MQALPENCTMSASGATVHYCCSFFAILLLVHSSLLQHSAAVSGPSDHELPPHHRWVGDRWRSRILNRMPRSPDDARRAKRKPAELVSKSDQLLALRHRSSLMAGLRSGSGPAATISAHRLLPAAAAAVVVAGAAVGAAAGAAGGG